MLILQIILQIIVSNFDLTESLSVWQRSVTVSMSQSQDLLTLTNEGNNSIFHLQTSMQFIFKKNHQAYR